MLMQHEKKHNRDHFLKSNCFDRAEELFLKSIDFFSLAIIVCKAILFMQFCEVLKVSYDILAFA